MSRKHGNMTKTEEQTMPRMKPKLDATLQSTPPAEQIVNGPTTEVLTLVEAAAYLRVREEELLPLVKEQGLPGRQLGRDWRFLKSAIQKWLGTPSSTKEQKEGIWAATGSWKDDPYLDEMLEEIYRRRGRPMIEE
jgi:excisionase family DNA binding protein